MSPACFEAQVIAHTPKLRRCARQFVRGAQDSEDLVQETLLLAWRAWGRTDVKNVWSWLWLIMRNVHLDKRDASKRWNSAVETHTDEIAAARATPPPPPDARLCAGADDVLLARIRELKGSQRAVIELHLDGYTDQEVAQQLQMNLTTVRTAACKARQRLRATL